MNEEVREDNVTCPYCGSIWEDSWEFSSDSEDCFECDECAKKFSWSRNVHVDYTCTPDCELNGEKHEFGDYGDVCKSTDEERCFRYRKCKNCGETDFIYTDDKGNKLTEDNSNGND